MDTASIHLEPIEDAFLVLESDLTVSSWSSGGTLFANAGEVVGKRLAALCPDIEGSAAEALCRDVVRTGRPKRTQLFSPSRKRWYDMRAYRAQGRVFLSIAEASATTSNGYEQPVFAKLLNRLNDMVIVSEVNPEDPSHFRRILYVNEAFVARYGYAPDEIIGKPFSVIDGPETDPEIVKSIHEAVLERRVFRGEIVNYAKSGEPFWVELDILPETDDVTGRVRFVNVERDITERKRLEEQLVRDRERLQFFNSVSNDILWEWDGGEYFTVSGATSLGDHLSSGRRIQSTLDEILLQIHPEDRNRVRTSLVGALASENAYWECDYRILKADGSIRYRENRAAIFRDEAGEASRMIGAANDVTEWRAMQDRLAAQEKLEALGTMAGGVSHDFNNILSVVLGSMDLLSDKDLNEPCKRLVETAIEAAEQGAALTHQLLAFARSQPLFSEPFDVNELIKDSKGIFRQAAPRAVVVVYSLTTECGYVNVDKDRLQAAILNLIINSGQAIAAEGRIKISTWRAKVPNEGADPVGGCLNPGEYVVIEVSDDGEGMSPSVQLHAFEPFFTTKGSGKGTGLGLSSVYGFAQQTGGTATISSELGEGTSVCIWLPADQDVGGKEGKAEPDITAFSGAGERVLLVEDDIRLRENTEMLLRQLSYAVIATATASEALEVLAHRHDVNVVLSDIVMPGAMDGLELARVIKRDYPHIPILLTTGYALGLSDGSAAMGIPVLRKPYRKQDIARSLRSLLTTS